MTHTEWTARSKHFYGATIAITEEPTAVKTIPSMFRRHDVAAGGVVSPLYRQLIQEWADLHTADITTTTVRRWGRAEPTLAGFQRPGDIVDAIDRSPEDKKDELLLSLIRLFQVGHQLAGRTVLQALLPKLVKTSAYASRMCTSSPDSWAEDRRHITLAEFWDVMGAYPVDRRTSNVASNLALDTLHRVSGARRPADDIPLDPHDIRITQLASDDDPATAAELTADADLLQVITWGLAGGVITRDEAQLLVESYLPTRRYGFADAAASLGLSPSAVRQRCSRTARKLTDAVRAEMLTDLDARAAVA